MAKNDYFVIMCRILAYLYACIKEGKDADPDVISFETLNIPEKYWTSIMINMYQKGYITGVSLVPVLGSVKKIRIDNLEITQEGIEFLQENSLMNKAREFLKTLKEIIPGI